MYPISYFCELLRKDHRDSSQTEFDLDGNQSGLVLEEVVTENWLVSSQVWAIRDSQLNLTKKL